MGAARRRADVGSGRRRRHAARGRGDAGDGGALRVCRLRRDRARRALGQSSRWSEEENALLTEDMELRLALSRDEWAPTVGQDNAISEAMLRALSSTGSEAGGWNAVVQPALDYSNLFRVNATELRIRLPAKPNYLVAAPRRCSSSSPRRRCCRTRRSTRRRSSSPPPAASPSPAASSSTLCTRKTSARARCASTSPCSTTRGCRPS